MWGWLTALIKGILQAVLPFLWKKVEQPDTIQDEQQIPNSLRNALDTDLADKLRDKQGDSPTDGSGSSGK